MTLDSSNVRVALTGSLMLAPIGTTAPSSATSTWPAGWLDTGYESEDGVTITPEDESNAIVAWQNGDEVRNIITSSSYSIAATCIETNALVVATYFGAVPTGSTGGPATLEVDAPPSGQLMVGLDVIDGANHIRFVAHSASLSERGEIAATSSGALGYPMTFKPGTSPGNPKMSIFFNTLAGLPAGSS